MESKFKNRILRFLLAFCIFIPITVLPLHFFSSKGMGPQSWEELWDGRWIFLGTAFIFALWSALDDDEELFWEKLKRKKKEKKTENEQDD